MGRKRGRIRLKPVLFIACEGTSTEYDYFSSWAKTDIAFEQFEAVNVYPGKQEINPKTNPYQLYLKAKDAIDNSSADIAWIVFDKDGHPLLPETFNKAYTDGVKIAFSSRSFEEWVLMHFEKINTTFLESECKDQNDKPINCGTITVPNCLQHNCIAGYIRRQNYIDKYSKKRTFDLYKAIKHRTEIALVNSAWLRFKVSASLNVTQPFLHELNPYTDVDQLIYLFSENALKIEWGNPATDIILNNWVINAELVNDNIIVKISHSKPTAQLLNPHFISYFNTTDDELNNIQCVEVNRQFLVSDSGSDDRILRRHEIVQFTFTSNNQPYFLFNDKFTNTRIYVVL